MEIIKKDNGIRGAFLAVEDGIQLGEMDYVWDGDKVIVINHTEVFPQYEGQGVGKKMFKSAVDFAREKEIKIIPTCYFVQIMFQRSPEYNDVLAN